MTTWPLRSKRWLYQRAKRWLTTFQKALQDGLTDLTPATMVWDEPTVWTVNEGEWAPKNYEDEYDGHITLRRALALSRNIATILSNAAV